MKIEKVALSSLKLWEDNPRGIEKVDFEELKKRLIRKGQFKPLLVNQDSIILGGNMRYPAMGELSRGKFPDEWLGGSVFKSRNEVVQHFSEARIVRVRTRNKEEMVWYALVDNERSGYYEGERLAELAIDFPELESIKIDLGKSIDLKTLLDRYRPVDEDEAPPISKGEPKSKLGEVYELGRHRLMCGDSLKKEDVEKLMDGKKADMVFTDPPYGVDLDTDFDTMFSGDVAHRKTGKRFDKVIGDTEGFDPTPYLNLANEVFMWGGDYYCRALPKGGSWFVWDKRLSESMDRVVGNTFEICWSKQSHKREIIRQMWSGHHGLDTEKRVHPTQKPVALAAWFIKKFSKEDNIIADLFGGSGSTLIACEQLDRTCYMMEIDPKYCDVIIKRYNNYVSREGVG